MGFIVNCDKHRCDGRYILVFYEARISPALRNGLNGLKGYGFSDVFLIYRFYSIVWSQIH